MVKKTVFSFLLLASLSLAAKPKVAVVDMDAIFTGYSRKIAIEQDVQAKIEALKQSPRVLAVQEMDAKLKELAQTVRDKTSPLETRELAAKEFNSLAIEHQSLIQEMEEFLHEEKRKATRELVETVEELIVEIRAEISKLGKEQNFDLVLEKGGKTSSQISPIIYLREKTNITDLIIERLNANAPVAADEEIEE